MFENLDTAVIWFGIIGLGVLIYVILDGFDLGIGILFPFIKKSDERDAMMNTVAPVWDGNETWMVLGGAGLYAAFPVVYATVLSALYMPITLMAIALIFRGVAFEFRFKANRTKGFWDQAFIWGSILASFLQGVILGAVIQGIETTNGIFSGNTFDWLSPFSLFVGLGVVAMYAVLGCSWLVMKNEGNLQRKLSTLMPKLLMLLAGIFIGVALFTPMINEQIQHRWADNLVYMLIIGLLCIAVFTMIWKAIQTKNDVSPFVYTLLLVVLAFVGFVLSLFPYIVPPTIDIWQASSPKTSQQFALVGALIFIPIILAYTLLSYWVFRDKVKVGDEGYH
ncbi:ubiquinol oxidase subunit II [Pasteurellaceae bacterium LFhippo2]|nr:ubiquinol oxidase subunit II [Pasteurellaceae bacterium LFhippo2]